MGNSFKSKKIFLLLVLCALLIASFVMGLSSVYADNNPKIKLNKKGTGSSIEYATMFDKNKCGMSTMTWADAMGSGAYVKLNKESELVVDGIDATGFIGYTSSRTAWPSVPRSTSNESNYSSVISMLLMPSIGYSTDTNLYKTEGNYDYKTLYIDISDGTNTFIIKGEVSPTTYQTLWSSKYNNGSYSQGSEAPSIGFLGRRPQTGTNAIKALLVRVFFDDATKSFAVSGGFGVNNGGSGVNLGSVAEFDSSKMKVSIHFDNYVRQNYGEFYLYEVGNKSNISSSDINVKDCNYTAELVKTSSSSVTFEDFNSDEIFSNYTSTNPQTAIDNKAKFDATFSNGALVKLAENDSFIISNIDATGLSGYSSSNDIAGIKGISSNTSLAFKTTLLGIVFRPSIKYQSTVAEANKIANYDAKKFNIEITDGTNIYSVRVSGSDHKWQYKYNDGAWTYTSRTNVTEGITGVSYLGYQAKNNLVTPFSTMLRVFYDDATKQMIIVSGQGHDNQSFASIAGVATGFNASNITIKIYFDEYQKETANFFIYDVAGSKLYSDYITQKQATHTQGKVATCGETGNIEYWTYDSKNYSDRFLTSEVSDVVLPKSDNHTYSAPVWDWTDLTSATATFTCSACSHKEVVNAVITNEVLSKPTLSEIGQIKYTATVTLNGKDYTDTKTQKYSEKTSIILNDEAGKLYYSTELDSNFYSTWYSISQKYAEYYNTKGGVTADLKENAVIKIENVDYSRYESTNYFDNQFANTASQVYGTSTLKDHELISLLLMPNNVGEIDAEEFYIKLTDVNGKTIKFRLVDYDSSDGHYSWGIFSIDGVDYHANGEQVFVGDEEYKNVGSFYNTSGTPTSSVNNDKLSLCGKVGSNLSSMATLGLRLYFVNNTSDTNKGYRLYVMPAGLYGWNIPVDNSFDTSNLTIEMGFKNIVSEDGYASLKIVRLAKNDIPSDFTAINHYAINYNLNGGTNNASNPSYYETSANDIVLQNPTKTNYTFTGWDNGGKILANETGDKTFTANFEINKFTVTLKDGEDTLYTISDVPYGTSGSAVYDSQYIPAKDNYHFIGWYIEDHKVDENDTVTADIELQAKWHELNYVEAKNPTCVKDGNDAYYVCEECGKFYSDAEGLTEIEENSWVILKTGIHEYLEGEVVSPTIEHQGYTRHQCKNCEYYYDDNFVEYVEEKQEETFVTFYGTSLLINDVIGLNFYIDCDSDSVKMFVATSNGEKEIDYVVKDGHKRFTVDLPAQDFDKKVEFYFSDGENDSLTYEYSISEYANAIKEDTQFTQEAVEMIEAMTDYASLANAFFNDGEFVPSKAVEDVEDGVFDDYNTSSEKIDDRIESVGMTLSLNEKVTINIYIQLADSVNIEDVEVKLNEEPIDLADLQEKTISGIKYYRFSIKDISPLNLGSDYSFTVGNNSYTCCALSLANITIQQDPDNNKVINLLKALYLYHNACKAYFE